MKSGTKRSVTEVVSFRVDSKSLEEFDRMAKDEMRTRGNMMTALLGRSLNVKKVLITNLEYLVKAINEEETRSPDSHYVEYLRGKFSSTKDALSLVYGKKEKDRVLSGIRRRTRLPIPHVVPLHSDGNRYGFDLDAD